jgi:hypothetical protein
LGCIYSIFDFICFVRNGLHGDMNPSTPKERSIGITSGRDFHGDNTGPNPAGNASVTLEPEPGRSWLGFIASGKTPFNRFAAFPSCPPSPNSGSSSIRHKPARHSSELSF